MESSRVRVHYKGSFFWLIFWFIVFFPIALTLLLTGSTFELYDTKYVAQYDGSRFWLCFWILVFFPVAFLLLFLNGFSVRVENIESEPPKQVDPPVNPPANRTE